MNNIYAGSIGKPVRTSPIQVPAPLDEPGIHEPPAHERKPETVPAEPERVPA